MLKSRGYQNFGLARRNLCTSLKSDWKGLTELKRKRRISLRQVKGSINAFEIVVLLTQFKHIGPKLRSVLNALLDLTPSIAKQSKYAIFFEPYEGQVHNLG